MSGITGANVLTCTYALFFFKGSGEATKLQQHLSLLKAEYVKLQERYQELEQKYAVAAATAGDVDQNSFVARLLLTVAQLYDQTLYR